MINYSRTILPNGLTVIAEQDCDTNLAAVNVLYKVGSRNEASERTGFAHLFEHLMFGGSTNAPDFDTLIQNASGESNAFTNSDYTNYYEVVPVENIETALWLEADRMINLNINQRSLSIQQKVVIEEFKEVCLNKPYGDNWHHLSSMAYKKHPYNWPTIGKTPTHIHESSIEDVGAFYKNFYTPSNAILTVSGPLTSDEIFKLAEKWFGNIPSKKIETFSFLEEELQTEQRYKIIKSDVPVPQFMGGCHMPGRNHKDYYSCDLLSDILANGQSSRLYSRLVRQKKIMTAVDCYLTGTFDPGLIIIEGRPAPGFSVEQGIIAFWEEIENLHLLPPNKRELQKVKNKVISSLAMSDLSVLNKAISMAYYEWLGALELMNKQMDFYNSVTVEDILNVAKKYLSPDNTSIVEYLPLRKTKIAS